MRFPAVLVWFAVLASAVGAGGDDDALWAWRPLAAGAVPGDVSGAGGGNAVDRFVGARLRAAGLEPSPPAGLGTLARRLCVDLTGLPPDPERLARLVADPAPDAYERYVAELLATTAYGERWARHWLDVVRYGESNGFEYNEPRRNAWPYRDWVVDAFNRDLPYDQFIRMQIAGDVLRGDAEGAAAVGFLVAGVHNTVMGAGDLMRRQARQEELEEIVGAVGQAVLGITVQCARCHDHKVDPVPTEDYYRIAAVFGGVRHGEREVTVDGVPCKLHTVVAGDPGVMRVHKRGSAADLGEEVTAGGLGAVQGLSPEFGVAAGAGDAGRRLRFAEWATHPENPLFARVMVNRVWHYHFGAGIVSTPNDFGRNGGRPSHPRLLDWLARWFRDSGYSLKALHQLIVTSATYRQASASRPEAMAKDSANQLLWRFSPRRIEAEALRDAMLAVVGEWNREMGGPGYEDTREEHFNAGRYYHPIDPEGAAFQRRSLYRFSPRGGRSALLDTFDCPDPSVTAPRRSVTTTPLQALALANNSFVWRMAECLARRVEREAGADVGAQVRRAWQLAACRPPDADEQAMACALVRAHGMPALCRVLFNSGDFVLIE